MRAAYHLPDEKSLSAARPHSGRLTGSGDRPVRGAVLVMDIPPDRPGRVRGNILKEMPCSSALLVEKILEKER
jgi:hypothetical protein